MRRVREGSLRDMDYTINPVNASSGVDSLRREEGDISKMQTENPETGNDTPQGGNEIGLSRS